MGMSGLASRKCIPCHDVTIQPLSADTTEMYLRELSGWQLQGHMISKTFIFKDFIQAIHFVQKVAFVAERAGHHPNIHIFYNKVQIDLYTHSINALSENDFILAAKINTIV